MIFFDAIKFEHIFVMTKVQALDTISSSDLSIIYQIYKLHVNEFIVFCFFYDLSFGYLNFKSKNPDSL